MGLFSKQKCFICGKEGRLLEEMEDPSGKRYLCDDCLAKMNCIGYVDYRNFINGTTYITQYTDLTQYSYYYRQIKKKYNQKDSKKICNSWASFSINDDFIAIHSYEELVVETKDVFAVCIEHDPKLSSDKYEAMVVTIFTSNPLFPFVSYVTFGKIGFFSVTRAKKEREELMNVFELHCQNLRCKAMSGKELKKFIKNDTELKLDKKKLLTNVFDMRTGWGNFNAKKLLKEQEFFIPSWATDLYQELGYTIV